MSGVRSAVRRQAMRTRLVFELASGSAPDAAGALPDACLAAGRQAAAVDPPHGANVSGRTSHVRTAHPITSHDCGILLQSAHDCLTPIKLRRK